MATNKFTTEFQSLNHRSNNIIITEAYYRTKIYNNNMAYVQWAASVASKSINHLNLRESMVCGCHQSKDIDVEHIPGIINPSDILKNDMKDSTHLIYLIYSMMVSPQAFLDYNHNVPSHIISSEKLLPYYSIRSEHIVPDSLELKSSVPEHIVLKILEPQLGFRQTV